MILTPQAFVAKWRAATAKERSAYQEHFIDLCHLVGHPTPMETDASGQTFAFEAGAAKADGGHGWADVFKPGHFAWEYKGPHADLDAAYQQLLQYRESLRNPPLLIVSDLADRIILHTNFTNTVKKVYTLSLDDLLTPDGLKILRAAFFEPETLRARQTTADVTREAAEEFARLAELLRKWDADAERSAHFLIRLLFCLFAEDVGLLPGKLFSRLLQAGRRNPKTFTAQLKQLFGAMATGGAFGVDMIPHFNGGLFDDDAVIELDSDGLDILNRVSALDWSSIEPSIFGTLFERSLDPAKRAQLGAHYTSKDDILLIVEPVLMRPLREKWERVKVEGSKLQGASGKSKARAQTKLKNLLTGFAAELAATKVLDPASGSGNFLYVSLRALLDLEKEVIALAGEWGVGRFFPSVSPAQLAGIEINPYAHELAQITIWIGYIQWLMENGFGFPAEPILKPLHTIRYMDAILDMPPSTSSGPALPVTEPDWPEADVIVGNPPFLGGNKIRAELGDGYVDALFKLYEGRIPAFADLVCYWFEKARAMIETGKAKRAGLLATNSIRGGANRTVLERIKQTGDIFWAHSDREWVLDGAAVRVSMVGFDNGDEKTRTLDGHAIPNINPDLTTSTDLTLAVALRENRHLCFRADEKGGPFEITNDVAQKMLHAPLNVNGRPNSDVILPWVNGLDITRNSRHMWIIDFGAGMSIEEAAKYELPFEYVQKHVKPERDNNKNANFRDKWWIHRVPGADMREAISRLSRYIATVRHAKYRLFVWLDSKTIPDSALYIFARDDDYFFGVLHSKPHELWSLRLGTSLEDRPRYTPTTTFETFPFPWPPGQEPKDDARVRAIAEAARELNELRERWLKPDLTPDPTPGPSPVARAATGEGGEAKKRTLTNLYNARPTWLDNAHKKLDTAVFAAYGWPSPSAGSGLSDDEILEKLLVENLKHAG